VTEVRKWTSPGSALGWQLHTMPPLRNYSHCNSPCLCGIASRKSHQGRLGLESVTKQSIILVLTRWQPNLQ